MIAIRSLFLVGGILIGLAVLMAAGVGLLLVFLEEISNDGRDFSALGEESADNNESLAESGDVVISDQINNTESNSFWPFSFPFLQGDQENEGNGFSGQAAGWLFGISCVPVALSLTTRFINRKATLPSSMKGSLERFARANKKYLMPFHTYLGIMGMILGVFHLIFSSCSNPLPEWGLIIAGILVISGLMIKYRIAAKLFPRFVKRIYQFHSSLVVTGILVSVLLAGHILMD
jgi:hypothetical protein